MFIPKRNHPRSIVTMFRTVPTRFLQSRPSLPALHATRFYATQQKDVSTVNVLPSPAITLVENGEKSWTTDELFKGKKVVVFGIPIPFSPVCQNTHCPSYVLNAAHLKKLGADEVVCVSVSDFFAMSAFGEKLNAKDKVLFLADPKAEFAKQIGMEFDMSGAGFGMRSHRYSLIVDDGKVKFLNKEDAPTELTVSGAETAIEQLKSLQ